MNKMEYKGYVGCFRRDQESGLYHGRLENIQDTVTFCGGNLEELRRALADSVEDYCQWCCELGCDPQKPCAGVGAEDGGRTAGEPVERNKP